MGMLIVDEEQFNKSLAKLCPDQTDKEIIDEQPKFITSLELGKVVDIQRGRGIGRLEVPETIRKLAAEEAICGASNKEVSQAFGISESSVSAYKNGATSTASYNQPDKELKQANNDLVTAISQSARQKLTLALAHITSDKISEAKIGVISTIAKDMSAIVRNLEPSTPASVVNNQVVVYRPKQKDEDEFDVITVNE